MNRSAFAAALRGELDEIAVEAGERQWRTQPELERRFGPPGKTQCVADARFHLRTLAQAVSLGRPTLFGNYLDWVCEVLGARGLGASDLAPYWSTLDQIICARWPDARGELDPYWSARASAIEPSGYLDRPDVDPALNTLARHYLDLAMAFDRRGAVELIATVVENGERTIREIYDGVFAPVQREVGRLWQRGLISVAQEHLTSATTQLAMGRLYPQIFTGRPGRPKVVVAAAADELHEIGLRMVADLLELDGWDTTYLGANTPVGALSDLLGEQRPALVCLSATLSYHLDHVKGVADRLPERDRTKLLVGGRAFAQDTDLWRDVGADGYAEDLGQALTIARQLAWAT
jgi:methanogenic corrinoid protein MtbC1